MNLLIKKVNTILPVLMTAILMLVMGHFCLQSIARAKTHHAETEHTHATEVADNNIQQCCQGNNSLDEHSVITQKSFNSVTLDTFTQTTFSYTSLDLYDTGQTLASPDISPHQFLKNSFRILLC